MEFLQEFWHKLHNLDELVGWAGYIGLFLIVYAETGLMVGFFLPGDSLLVTAGVFAAANPDKLNITSLICLLIIAAIAGDNTGYWFGRKAGAPLFARPDSRFFKRKHLVSAQAFYDKHGAKTVVLARFVPIVRTFGPIVAGVAEMPYRRFLTYSIIGGISWITSMLLLGYFLGQVPGVKDHIDKVIIVVIAVSLLPVFLHWLQGRKHGAGSTSSEDVVQETSAGEH
jgi:membrane-associated protein